jgi:hypothetical protein
VTTDAASKCRPIVLPLRQACERASSSKRHRAVIDFGDPARNRSHPTEEIDMRIPKVSRRRLAPAAVLLSVAALGCTPGSPPSTTPANPAASGMMEHSASPEASGMMEHSASPEASGMMEHSASPEASGMMEHSASPSP